MSVRFESSINIGSLGRWQQPILAAVKERLPGSFPNFASIPNGGAVLVVDWDGFAGKDDEDRAMMVRGAVRTLGNQALTRVTSVLAMTPTEAAETEARLGYHPWRTEVFGAIRESAPLEAGKLVDNEGE